MTSRYGRRYYHFIYKNVLFLSLCSENPPDGMGTIDKEQQEWVAQDARREQGGALDVRLPPQADLEREGPRKERLGGGREGAGGPEVHRLLRPRPSLPGLPSQRHGTTTNSRRPAAAAGCAASNTASSTTSPG